MNTLTKNKKTSTKKEVMFTKDLDIFQFHPVNRDRLNNRSEQRIRRISKSMVKEGLLLHPILVSSNMFVIDGQHRLEAAKIAKKGIYYIVDNTISNTPEGIFEAAMKHNRDAKEWTKNDYLHGFSQMNYQDYEILEQFHEKFKMFSLTENMMFLNNSATKNTSKQGFANGDFTVKNLELATEWANRVSSLKPYFPQGYNKSSFVRALIKIFETKPDFKWSQFIHKVNLRPGNLHLCGDMLTYTMMIEQIYNHGSHTKLNLRW